MKEILVQVDQDRGVGRITKRQEWKDEAPQAFDGLAVSPLETTKDQNEMLQQARAREKLAQVNTCKRNVVDRAEETT